MSSTEVQNLLPTSSPEVLEALADLPTTSFVLKNCPPALKPKIAVACMNCPSAVWIAKSKSVECYCRVLYLVTWETSKQGSILMCDIPEQARLEALEAEDLPEQPAKTYRPESDGVNKPSETTPAVPYDENNPFGLANLPAPTATGSGFL